MSSLARTVLSMVEDLRHTYPMRGQTNSNGGAFNNCPLPAITLLELMVGDTGRRAAFSLEGGWQRLPATG
jgi:hypothetical protein